MLTESERKDRRKRILWSLAMLVVIWVVIGLLFSTGTGGFISGLYAAGIFYLGTSPEKNRDLHKD